MQTQRMIQPTLFIVRAESGLVSSWTSAMIPKIDGIMLPHSAPKTISRIAWVWSFWRSGTDCRVGGVIGGMLLGSATGGAAGWRGTPSRGTRSRDGARSVLQRAAVGVALEGLGPSEHHDALDEAPEAAEAAGDDGDDDLDDADRGVAQ